MIEGRASRTAARTAMRRALHQLVDEPRVHDDPLALPILDARTAAAMRARPERFAGGAVGALLRAFLVARSRVAEDALAAAVAAGVRTYVVLGAGLDTFAYRSPHPDLRVVEVDHPATQAWKRRRLAASGIAVPATVTFAAVDFATGSVADALRAAGLSPGAPVFFSWLGVTPYLEPPAVLATLAAIAPFATGGGVAVDYVAPPARVPVARRAAFDAVAARVAAAGEPFRGFFAPDVLARALGDLGFGTRRDLGPDELNAAFFAGRRDGLRVGSLGRVLVASSRP